MHRVVIEEGRGKGKKRKTKPFKNKIKNKKEQQVVFRLEFTHAKHVGTRNWISSRRLCPRRCWQCVNFREMGM